MDDPLKIFQDHESPGTKTFSLTESPPLFVSGDGSWLLDADGRRYLDFASGSGTSALGHGHPAIRAAIEAQARTGIVHIGPHFHAESQRRLFERLTPLLPRGLDRLHPATNGTEATETAIKIAIHATGRSRFLAFEGGYHGRTLGALAVSAERGVNDRFGALFPPIDVLPYPWLPSSQSRDPQRRQEAARSVRQAMQALPGPYAGVIIELVQATAGVRIAPDEALIAIAEIAGARGWPLIVDEVFTAFGRTGSMFRTAALGLDADLLILAKGLGGGMPLGLVAGRADLVDRLPVGAQSSTFQLHPMSAATSSAMLDVAASGSLDGAALRIGGRMEARTGELLGLAGVRDVRGAGALWGIDLVGGPQGPRARARTVRRAALARGLITWECGEEANVIGLVPPLIATDDEVDRALDILVEAIAGVPLEQAGDGDRLNGYE